MKAKKDTKSTKTKKPVKTTTTAKTEKKEEAPKDEGVIYENTLKDVVKAFRELPEWKGVLVFDEFRHSIVFAKKPPFATEEERMGQAIRDDDVLRIRLLFQEKHDLKITTAMVLDAARIVSRDKRVHDVRDYLVSLPKWDKKKRIDTWLETFCNVKPETKEMKQLVASVSRKFLIACVARAMKPGCKVDTMLILEGEQGIGKSTILRTLASDRFFCDALLDVAVKDSCQQIQGVWLYEMAELDALLRGKSSASKAFLTRANDKFRAPYARSPSVIPRSVVFCGTVNHSGYLRDKTGNRRFWIVSCSGKDKLDSAGLALVRDQLFAEAYAAYQGGEVWHLNEADENVMAEVAKDREEIEPWDDLIGNYLKKEYDGKKPLVINTVLEGALGLKNSGRNPTITRRVSAILESQGLMRKRQSVAGVRSYGYVRAASLPHCPTAPLLGARPTTKGGKQPRKQ